MADVTNYRRAMLLAARDHAAMLEFGIEGVCLANQRAATPATPLPDSLAAFAARLSAVGYRVREDLDGADAAELIDQGFKRAEAAIVLAALET